MKKQLLFTFFILLIVGCNSTKKFYNSGYVNSKNDIEKIDINIVNGLPLCKVEIEGEIYIFLVDTGAPTVISDEIFQTLKLKESHKSSMTDSQNKKRLEKFAVIPQIKIGNLIFENIGSAVIKFENNELKCFGFDGIVGANLLSHIFCEFNYKENKILVSKNLSAFSLEKYDLILNFKHKNQKTPIINGKIFDKNLSFTFDTGFAGIIKIPNNLEYYKNKISEEKLIITNGASSIGLYGKSDFNKTFELKNNIYIDNTLFEDELIDSGESTLIGNEFLKNYIFLIDWKSNKIYLKSIINSDKKQIRSFGFSYLFSKGKAIVVSKIEDKKIPINLGDEIIRIDDFDFATIKNEDFCKYYLNKVEKDREVIDITIKRDNNLLNFKLEKQTFIK
jgi:predicted aspartyl protease